MDENAFGEVQELFGVDEELDWGDTTIVLTDEDGEPVVFEVLDTMDYQDVPYLVVSPIEEGVESSDVLVMRMLADEGDESVLEVADDDVAAAVFERFMEAHADEYDFEEGDD